MMEKDQFFMELNIKMKIYSEIHFLGEFKPVTGALITGDTATYIYTGVETNYSIGKLNITPSFTPGLYSKGDGKDLGHPLEFKSEVQMFRF